MKIEETTLSSETVYKCPIFKITKSEVLLPNGNTVRRDCLVHNGGCGILPVTEDGKVYLVEQYRYGIGQTTLEIPAGKLEAGEQPLVCAKRELEEEIGARSEHIISLGSIAVSPAYDSEIIYIYLADKLTFSAQNLDADEFLNVKKVSFADALEMIEKGRIIDAKTIVALLRARDLL